MRGGSGALVLGIGISFMPINLESSVILKAEAHKRSDMRSEEKLVSYPAGTWIKKYTPLLEEAFVRIEKGYEKRLENVNSFYAAKLKRLQRQRQLSGDLEGYLALGEEIDKIDSGEIFNATDIPENIYNLRQGFFEGARSNTEEKHRQVVGTVSRWTSLMNRVMQDFTKKGEIEEGVKIMEEIRRIQTNDFYLATLNYSEKSLPEDSPVRLNLDRAREDRKKDPAVNGRSISPYEVFNTNKDGEKIIGASVLDINPGGVDGETLTLKFNRDEILPLRTSQKLFLRVHTHKGPYGVTKDRTIVYMVNQDNMSRVGSLLGIGAGWHEIELTGGKIASLINRSGDDLELMVTIEDGDNNNYLDGLKIDSAKIGRGPSIVIKD
jgi:hypothetical protein